MKTRKAVPDRFKDMVALVTGGSVGIGRSVVDELCKEGAKVALTGIERDLCAEAQHELAAAGYEVLVFCGDMASEEFCRRVVHETVARWGKLNFLVNNAFSFTAKWSDASLEDWHRVMDVGPIAFARMASESWPHMRDAGGGAIVNLSSISAFIAQPKRWTYNAAKGAVNTLTKCMALDLAPYGIRVNSVSPGWIWTREVLKAASGDRPKWDPVWGQFHMLERCGDPVEVAAAILFLLSDDASFITGTDLPVDGGYQSMAAEGLGRSSAFAGSK